MNHCIYGTNNEDDWKSSDASRWCSNRKEEGVAAIMVVSQAASQADNGVKMRRQQALG